MLRYACFAVVLAVLPLMASLAHAQSAGRSSIVIDDPVNSQGEIGGRGIQPTHLPNKQVLALLANASEEHRTRVAVMLEDQMKRVGGCTRLTRLDAEEIWVVEPVSFYGSKLPSKGKWQVRYTATQCGQKVPRNVVFSARSFNRVGIEVMMPGTTLADPQLAEDVWKSFQLSALKLNDARARSCTTPVLTNTEVLEHPGTPGGIWREVWTARLCDRDMAQVVSFYPTAMGTMFRMALPGADKARLEADAPRRTVKSPAQPSYRPAS